MKHVIAVGLVVLLALNVTLWVRHGQLNRQVASLQQDNVRLGEELAARPAITAEEFKAAHERLDRANSVMDAVESRLTNAAAVLSQVQSSAAILSSATPHRVPGGPMGGPRTGSSAPRATIPSDSLNPAQLAAQMQLQVSSSHDPNGQVQRRSWGPEQVLGPPNTDSAGDLPTAWAPLSSMGAGEEWLHVDYEQPVDISEVVVRETHNPGAISKLAAVMADGSEVTIWEGVEPSAKPPVNMTFQANSGIQARSIKVYLDRTRVPGWNEIDAVELVGRDGSRQWASSARASSSFAEPRRNVALDH